MGNKGRHVTYLALGIISLLISIVIRDGTGICLSFGISCYAGSNLCD